LRPAHGKPLLVLPLWTTLLLLVVEAVVLAAVVVVQAASELEQHFLLRQELLIR
jgi:hypothetical protein